MNAALLLLSLAAGNTPDEELELARAAVAVELAKLSLEESPPKEPPAVLPTVDTYADVYTRVLSGERLTWTGTPPGKAFGTYRCELRNGVPWMEEVKPVAATPKPDTSVIVLRTTARGAARSWDESAGTYRTVNTFTPTATFHGPTNCAFG